MSPAILKTTILSIIVMGIVIFLAVIALLCWKNQIVPYMRYLLPIPPIRRCFLCFRLQYVFQIRRHTVRPLLRYHQRDRLGECHIFHVIFCVYIDSGVYGGFAKRCLRMVLWVLTDIFAPRKTPMAPKPCSRRGAVEKCGLVPRFFHSPIYGVTSKEGAFI